tara:strand:- start:52 stop:2142 length:2091 start_codon:yes stop_codon:yes gene_type:complete
MALSTENQAYELLVRLFEEAKQDLADKAAGTPEARKARTDARRRHSRRSNEFSSLSQKISEWEEWKKTPGAFAADAQVEKWEEIFGTGSGWDGEDAEDPDADAGSFFRSKIADAKEKQVGLQKEVTRLRSELDAAEDEFSNPDVARRRQEAELISVGEPSAEEMIDWLVGEREDDAELVFRDELRALSEGQTEFEYPDNPLGSRVETPIPQRDREGVLSYEGRLQLKEVIDDRLLPYSGPAPGELTTEPLSAGEELSESEMIRETPITTRDMEMQEEFESQLARQRIQRENRGRDRGFDQRLQEFGPPVTSGADKTGVFAEGDTRVNPNTGLTEKYIGGQWVAGSEGADGQWVPGGTAEREILQGIGETFDVAAQFGYRFFFFEPGTQNPRQDMLITDPDLLAEGGYGDTPVNVLQYIKDQNLTDPNEIRAAFSTTQWFADTNETMQQFDLEWSAAGSPTSLNDEITLRRRELIADQENYIRDQLALLGLEDKVTDDQIADLAILAKRTGMDNQAVRQTMTDVNSEFLNFTSFAGEMDTGLLGVYKSGVENMAGQYMIGLSDASLDEWVTGMFESEDPELQLALYREEMQQLAKERFPTIGGLIDQGMTPKQYFAPYKDKAELLLERPVDFMGGDANWFDKIANGTPDNETGSRVMTYTEANKFIRGLPEWQTTKNANDEAREIADNIGRMFGFVA